MPNLFFVTFVSSSWLELLANYFLNLYSSFIWPKMDYRKVTVNQILISVTQHREMGLSLWIFHTFPVDCCDWTMDNTQVSYKKKELFALREDMGSSPFLWGPCSSSFSFSMFCLFGLFVGAKYLMPNDASIFGQSILHCPVGYL